MGESLKNMVNRLSLGLVKPPRCPLCLELMERKWEPARGFFIFACDTDRVAIRVDDPFVGRWEEALQKTGGAIQCPNCNADMRYFATSTGYMKAKCPKKSCGCTVASAEPDREKDAIVATPDKPGVVQ